jgi:hypothetical protein
VSNKRHELSIIGGIGYEDLGTLSSNSPYYSLNNSNAYGGDIYSINLNAGMGYKMYFIHKTKSDKIKNSYISLEAKYNNVRFDNSGGTNLNGNAWTIGLVYGAYSHKVKHYYIEW